MHPRFVSSALIALTAPMALLAACAASAGRPEADEAAVRDEDRDDCELDFELEDECSRPARQAPAPRPARSRPPPAPAPRPITPAPAPAPTPALCANGLACTNASVAAWSARRYDDAVRDARRACDLGNLDGCVVLGRCIGDGTGAPRDPATAVALYQRGCDGGVRAGCHNLAQSELDGNGVPKDVARARAHFDKACRAGLQAACQELAKLTTPAPAPAPSVTQPAVTPARAAVTPGSRPASYPQVEAAIKRRDPGTALGFLSKACDHGDLDACAFAFDVGRWDSGLRARDGVGGRPDLAIARELLDYACRKGIMEACDDLSGLR